MDIYKITAFDQQGQLLFEDSFSAAKDEEAKEIGKQKLEEHGLLDQTHRLVSPRGKLLLFHS
ncbi:YhzD family protein [Jeotgalibacillus proteolyticus]|uniref:YhzD-like protein n=1 Tax=Jeotgalibacillus proteolyticus TaxID=2082395 RepID=A0A2S5GHI6_9BACL|nr:YhzD family protein [Jeotgalibacillus proteolyticus]PPA72418.1 hypothetical protein C4B60_03315 [Jeotgalibacillus proteolyticus]